MKIIIYDKEKGRIENPSVLHAYYLHREDGPAYIEHYPNGKRSYEGWWLNNEEHRENGAARIAYGTDGSIIWDGWCLHDNTYTKEDHERELTKLKINKL